MKQAVLTFLKPITNRFPLGIVYHLGVFVMGFIMSGASVFNSVTPFGCAFVGGMPKLYILPAALGAMTGYLFSAKTHGFFTYLAALFAIAAIRFILSGFLKFDKNPFWASVTTFTVLLFVMLAVKFNTDGNLILVLAEALLGGTASYFINTAFKIKTDINIGLMPNQTVAVLFTLSLVVLGLMPINIYGVSIGKIAAFIIILSAARYGGISLGTVSGVLICFLCVLFGENIKADFLFFVAGGLFAGFFKNLGKLGNIMGVLICAVFAVCNIKDYNEIAARLVEIIIASGIFLLLPKKINGYINFLFLNKAKANNGEEIKGAIVMKLEFASGALRNVSNTIDEVSKELSRINSPDFEQVLKCVENSSCIGCSLRIHCWETEKSETVENILSIARDIKNNEKEQNFKAKCLRYDIFYSSVKKHYLNYLSRLCAEQRIDEIRNIISDQFDGIADMLYDLSYEFKTDGCMDYTAANDIIATLRNMDINAEECIAYSNSLNRLSADIKVKLLKDTSLNKLEIMKNLSVACNREFDAPLINKNNKEAFISISEKPNIYPEIAVAQYSANDNAMCGDSYDYFLDGKGRMIMLLSDGMGNGGRAAVDSAMMTGLLSRLIKSGFGFDCSLKIANSSMLFKSSDESLATVDITAIDLFSGKTTLLKAGAAPTIVRRKGRCAKAQSTSLAAGIIREIGFDKAEITLSKNDCIVMMSDGVNNEGTDWIVNEIENFEIGSAKELAERIALMAKRRRSDGHTDDITVMVALLNKNQ